MLDLQRLQHPAADCEVSCCCITGVSSHVSKLQTVICTARTCRDPPPDRHTHATRARCSWLASPSHGITFLFMSVLELNSHQLLLGWKIFFNLLWKPCSEATNTTGFFIPETLMFRCINRQWWYVHEQENDNVEAPGCTRLHLAQSVLGISVAWKHDLNPISIHIFEHVAG